MALIDGNDLNRAAHVGTVRDTLVAIFADADGLFAAILSQNSDTITAFIDSKIVVPH